MNNILEVHNVVKAFSNHTALNDVSINVPEGCVFGLLGRNGAGKTTLIRIINRITAPDNGHIVFNGHEMTPDDVALIGYLPEERGLYRKMKVGEQAVYLGMLKGLSRNEAQRRLKKWFEKLDILSWWDRKLEELSKGMQQKVQFVITVVHEPKLLIFDEPFSGFDPVNARLLKNEMLELRDKGHTIIYSTHNMESVEEVCDYFAIIDKSRVALSGKVDEVRRKFREGIYDVSYEGNVSLLDCERYKVISSGFQGNETYFKVSKTNGTSNSQLAGELAKHGELMYFAEKFPSMNDIFVKTVGE